MNLNIGSFCVVAFLSAVALAGDKHEHHGHHEHGAHVHGVAELSIAFDKNVGKIELESPAMDIIGFEHKPNKPADKKKVADVLSQLKVGSSLFTLPGSCTVEKGNVEHKFAGNHSEVEASWTVQCSAPIEGEKIEILLGKKFPGLKKIKVDVLTENLQKSFELSEGKTTVDLKK